MDSILNNQNDQWELNLDINDSDLKLTPAAKLLKQTDIPDGGEGCVMSTQEYIKKIIEDVGEDEDFKSGSWVSATDYVNANGGIVSGCLGDIKNFLKNGKLDQVVAIVKSCSLNVIGDLTWCGWEWNVNGRRRNSEIDGRRRMADLELQVCENVTDQEMADEEALNHALEKEARQAWTEHKWLEKCGQFLMLNENANAHVNVYLSAALSSIHDRMKVWFVQKRAKEEAFAGFLRDQCAGLRMTNSKNQRLIAKLEALGEQGCCEVYGSHKRNHCNGFFKAWGFGTTVGWNSCWYWSEG
ncbi:hypothetical protein Tco_0060068 [Tanacetum coccineum]